MAKLKEAPKLSLLEQACALPVGRRPADWLSRLPDEQRREVEELLLAKLHGRILASCKQIVELLARHGIESSINKVSRSIDQLAKR